jgi:hypothetical protein
MTPLKPKRGLLIDEPRSVRLREALHGNAESVVGTRSGRVWTEGVQGHFRHPDLGGRICVLTQ